MLLLHGGGTDEEIVEAVQKADDGDITLSDYWAVGDAREVPYGSYTQSLILTNKGYKNNNNVHFVVHGLKTIGTRDIYISGSLPNYITSLRDGHKFSYTTASFSYSGSTVSLSTTTNATSAAFSEKEITGSNTFGQSVENVHSQMTYFKTTSNRKKKNIQDDSDVQWRTRSPSLYDKSNHRISYYVCITNNGYADRLVVSTNHEYDYGLVSFFCI